MLVSGVVHQPVHQPRRRLSLAVVAPHVPTLGNRLVLVREVVHRGAGGRDATLRSESSGEHNRGMRDIAWMPTAAIITIAEKTLPGNLLLLVTSLLRCMAPGWSLYARRLIHETS